MKITSLLVALALLASPALAQQQKIDEGIAKAEEQFQKGKQEEALKTLHKLVSQNPGSVQALLALGRLHERMGTLDEAADSLEKAAKAAASAPPSVRAEALAAVSAMDLRRGTGKDALAHATHAVEAQSTPATLAALARAQLRAGSAITALQTAERAVQAGPTSALAHEARGSVLLAMRREDEAVAAFRKALELDPKHNRPRVGLALALLGQGKAAEAVAEARKATEIDSKNGEAFAVLGWAMVSENQDNWNEAIAQAQQGAFLNQRSVLIQTLVGRIFEANASLDQAANSYRKAIEIDPGYVPAQTALITVQSRKGDTDGALAAARKLAQESPQNGEAQFLLGRSLLRREEFGLAAEALQKAVELQPNLAEAHAYLGTAYQYTRRTPEALAAYKRATELAPDNIEYKTTYGLLLGLTEEYEAGAELLRKVIATPGYKKPDAYLNLGWVYRNMKPPRTEESVAAYKKALELDPKEEQAALGMGWAYSYTRLWDEAIAAFRKAVELRPDIAGEAYDGMAWCFFFKKEMKEARAQLEKAQAAGRTDSRLKENIERIEKLIAAGEAAKVRQEIEKTEGPKECDLGGLVRDLGAQNVNVRKRAAQELRDCGPQAAQYLGYTLLKEPDINVRRAALTSLQAMGSAARGAIAQLKEAMAMRAAVGINPTRAEMEAELAEEDLRRDIRTLLEKLTR